MLLLFACSVAEAQKVTFFTPSIVRVVKDKGQTMPDSSLVVIAKPGNVSVKEKHDRATGTVTYTSSTLTVTVHDGNVTFTDRKGKVLMSEGHSTFTPITTGIDKGRYMIGQTFSCEKDEGIYGVGLLQNGKMSQRGENRLMQQSNLEDYAHFYQSIKGYGIYWDNYSPTQFVTPSEGQSGEVSLLSQVGNKVDYYFLYGGNADGVVKAMRHLTGKSPMMPLWTYGFHQSRERYKSQDELLEVVHKYRDLNIPFDGIIQDWQYWGSNYTWNAMEFISENFPKAQLMIDDVHRNNAHMSISIWSSFGPYTKAYSELKAKNHLFSFDTWPESGLSQWPPRKDYPSGVRVYDCYSKEARDIYWQNLSRLHAMGIDAWWMDSTDPDHVNYKDSDLDERCSMGSWRSVRNVFSLMTVGGVYDHQRAVDSTKRVFILTRSYFAGQQRYGANTWSGDINSSWESLRTQIPICLNYTLTGAPHVNTDIGGFFAGKYNRAWGGSNGYDNPQYQELYTRWMQFGAFTPMMRSHGTDVYRELYYYGKAGEPVFDALKDAVKLRYRFLPYIYSLSWQVTKNDDSFMRALFMQFNEDKNTWNNNSQYMFGHNILVCPVVKPLYTKEKIVKTDANSGWNKDSDGKPQSFTTVDWTQNKQYEVYLPSGAEWYDYWTGKKMNASGVNVTVDAPISHSPLFIKGGTILCQGPDVQYSNEKAWDNLDITVYPGTDTSFTLYEDEGDNYNYEKGKYTEIPMSWNDKNHTLTIGKRQGAYTGMLKQRKFNVSIVGGKTVTVNYNGKKQNVSL